MNSDWISLRSCVHRGPLTVARGAGCCLPSVWIMGSPLEAHWVESRRRGGSAELSLAAVSEGGRERGEQPICTALKAFRVAPLSLPAV